MAAKVAHLLAATNTLNVPECLAREWLRAHREIYAAYWRWSDAVVDAAMLTGIMRTCYGWQLHVTADTRPNTLRNWPMQAHGAEMMRLACCLTTERGIAVCCPVHDALLVEGPTDGIEAVVAETQRAMREASELVLPGFPLRTDAKVVRYPDRYMDDRGRGMWETVCRLLGEEEAQPDREDPFPGGQGYPFPGGNPTPSLGEPPVPLLHISLFLSLTRIAHPVQKQPARRI